MKIERLIGIIITLQQKKIVTKSLDSVSYSASAERLAQKIGGSSAIRLADRIGMCSDFVGSVRIVECISCAECGIYYQGKSGGMVFKRWK